MKTVQQLFCIEECGFGKLVSFWIRSSGQAFAQNIERSTTADSARDFRRPGRGQLGIIHCTSIDRKTAIHQAYSHLDWAKVKTSPSRAFGVVGVFHIESCSWTVCSQTFSAAVASEKICRLISPKTLSCQRSTYEQSWGIMVIVRQLESGLRHGGFLVRIIR